MKQKIKLNDLNKLKELDHVLVYSTEGMLEKSCSGCNKLISNCDCSLMSSEDLKKIKPKVRIEKKGRGGKVVTILYGLPEQDIFLKDLCKYLKAALGSGGTYYSKDSEGIVEIQGDWHKNILEVTQKYLTNLSS